MSFGRYPCDDLPMPRPATGRTPLRNIRVPASLWNAAKEKADAEGRSLSEVIVSYLRRYVGTPPRKKRGED